MLERTKVRELRRTKPTGAHFVLIEDDPSDAELLQESFRGSRFQHSWNVFQTGEEALAYLRSLEAPWKSSCLILLDLNLPEMDGRQVLSELKTDPRLRIIPVIVLTASNSAADVQQAYERHANSYIAKPAHLNQLQTIAKRIEDYWLETVQLPR